MIKKLWIAGLITLAAGSAQATVYQVFAQDNSSSGGTGLATISLTAGQSFTVTASTDDLWSAGNLPRFSDANGLVANRNATAQDDSGFAPGTQIGADFGSWTQDGHSAPYGALVGKIGGQYITLGTNFIGNAPVAGTLSLYYWDSNNGDNTGSILANVSAAPEPETWAMMLAGLGLVASATRRKKTA
ncbi:MAG: PEPxxWA-CTERM sorting domain-containing protein [Pseudomonadota bacterium]